jgi:PD-(D/E)XK nuclease superfamily
MNTKQILQKLSRDSRIEKLEIGLKRPNIFKILGLEHAEIRHSNFLAWLLEPKGSHELGTQFLKLFLKDVFAFDVYGWSNEFKVDGMNLNTAEIRREWEHIDILIETDEFVVAIENKILSGEHSNQLSRYKKKVELHFPKPRHNHAFVFLTPDGIPPTDKEDDESYEIYTYDKIVRNLHRILDLRSEDIRAEVRTYLKDYIRMVNQTVLENDELNDLAKSLYESHSEAFEFVFRNKPDRLAEVQNIFREAVLDSGWDLGSTNKGYVRFTSKSLAGVIPKTGVGPWKNCEQFLFEIEIGDKGFRFFATISPGNSKNRSILERALKKATAGHEWQKNPHRNWQHRIYLSKTWKSKLLDPSITDSEIREKLGKLWPKITEAVNTIETEILRVRTQFVEE